jgi:hypothetical protein
MKITNNCITGYWINYEDRPSVHLKPGKTLELPDYPLDRNAHVEAAVNRGDLSIVMAKRPLTPPIAEEDAPQGPVIKKSRKKKISSGLEALVVQAKAGIPVSDDDEDPEDHNWIKD